MKVVRGTSPTAGVETRSLLILKDLEMISVGPCRLCVGTDRAYLHPLSVRLNATRQKPAQPAHLHTVQGADVPQRPKLQRAMVDLMAALPEGSTEDLTHGQLVERLPGLKESAYCKRTAREALQALVPQLFTSRKAGKNTLYKRDSEG